MALNGPAMALTNPGDIIDIKILIIPKRRKGNWRILKHDSLFSTSSKYHKKLAQKERLSVWDIDRIAIYQERLAIDESPKRISLLVMSYKSPTWRNIYTHWILGQVIICGGNKPKAGSIQVRYLSRGLCGFCWLLLLVFLRYYFRFSGFGEEGRVKHGQISPNSRFKLEEA